MAVVSQQGQGDAAFGGQRYRFGWLIACASLGNSYPDPRLDFYFGISLAIWNLVAGLAAASTRPWSWYALLASFSVGIPQGALYIASRDIASWHKAIFISGLVIYCVFSFGYFYKRRVMFGASRRWALLERWCPGVVGPETHGPDAPRGFFGLSYGMRAVVVLVVATLLASSVVSHWIG